MPGGAGGNDPISFPANDGTLGLESWLMRTYTVLSQCSQSGCLHCNNALTSLVPNSAVNLEVAIEAEPSSLLGRDIDQEGDRVSQLAKRIVSGRLAIFRCRISRYSQGLQLPPTMARSTPFFSGYKEFSTTQELETALGAVQPDQREYLLRQPPQDPLCSPPPTLSHPCSTSSTSLSPTWSPPYMTPSSLSPTISSPYTTSSPSLSPTLSPPYTTSYPSSQSATNPLYTGPYVLEGEPSSQEPQPMHFEQYISSTADSSMIGVERPNGGRLETVSTGEMTSPQCGRECISEVTIISSAKRDLKKIIEEQKRRVAEMLDGVRSQDRNRWTFAKHDWYPFIGPKRETQVPVNAEHLPSKDPKEIVVAIATRLAQRSTEATEGELFLLVCLCQVVKNKVSPNWTLKVFRICFPSMKKQTLVDYLGSVFWVGTLMNDLFLNGWDNRGIDLLVSWDCSLADYTRLKSRDFKTNKLLVEELCKPEYRENYLRHPDLVTGSLPFIVHFELQNSLSYPDVCKYLGYSPRYIEATQSTPGAVSTYIKEINPSSQRDMEGVIDFSGEVFTSVSDHYMQGFPEVASSMPQNSLNRPSDGEQNEDDVYHRRFELEFEEWT